MSGHNTCKKADILRAAIDRTPDCGNYLVLNPDLTVVGASDEYLQATLVGRSEITGCDIFNVFPDNPSQADADGVLNLTASLGQVLRSGEPSEMPIQRYDVRDRVSGSGRWVEKHWLPVNRPVFGSGSSEIVYIIHHAIDVTEAVSVEEWIDDRALAIEEQLAMLEEMKSDIAGRTRSGVGGRRPDRSREGHELTGQPHAD